MISRTNSSGEDASLLPFSVDRKSWIKLPHQVADGLRRGIASGFWRAGERLPSTRMMKSILGVAARVPQEALQILAKEGLVSLRTRSGATVTEIPTAQKNHRILLVLPGGLWVFNHASVCDRLLMRLTDAGYNVTLSLIGRVGARQHYDLAHLKADLRQRYELVVCLSAKSSVISVVKESCQPFVLIDGKAVKAPGFVGNVAFARNRATDALVSHCRRRRVRRVIVVSKWRNNDSRLLSALNESGIEAMEWIVHAPVCLTRGEAVERAAFDAFDRRLKSEGKAWLPDLLHFTDDFACYGAMTAMLVHGIRIPEDVRVSTLANRGSRRAFPASLTCIEHDGNRVGDIAAETVLKYLRTGVFPPDVTVGPVFVVGGSFR